MKKSPTFILSIQWVDRLGQWRAPPGFWLGYFALLNAVYLLWLGSLKFTVAERADVLKWWHASTLWQGLHPVLPVFPSDQMVPLIGAAIELSAGVCLLAYRRGNALRWGAVLATIVYGFNLVYLLTNPIWIEKMGGFPFLGAGQGTIKYLPMLATSLYLLAQGSNYRRRIEKIAALTGLIGALLVMAWIGSMKFFLFEAQGIEPLLRNHWVFAWMYNYWSLQGVSNIIGMTEWVFALLLAAAAYWPALRPVAATGIGITVACTTSFMFTLPGWAADAQFPILNGSGVFLLKDQFLLAATLLLFSLPPNTLRKNTLA